MKASAFVLIALTLLPVEFAFADGWRWDVRYRAEVVDDADAHTLRVRLGHSWAPVETRWSALLEGEHLEPLHDTLVADPRATEINQAWLRFSGEAVTVTAGRQRLLFDNQRFVGNVGWRQNEQTFDALHAEFGLGEARARYAYLDRVHRVFGDDRDHDSHLLNVGWDGLSAYAYLLDDRDAPAASSATVGVRWVGAHAPFGWTVEAARQRDHADRTASFSLYYFLVAPTVRWRGVQWTVGWERLDGDGVRGFATPLATLHAFNGWADRFLMTPAAGLDDRHVVASGTALGGQWVLAYRSYRAVFGDADLGHEWNASYGRALPTGFPLHWLVKVADHRGGTDASDVRKIWLQVEWRGR